MLGLASTKLNQETTYAIFSPDADSEGDLGCDEDEAEVDVDGVEVGVEVGDPQQSQEGDEQTHDGQPHPYIHRYRQGHRQDLVHLGVKKERTLHVRRKEPSTVFQAKMD